MLKKQICTNKITFAFCSRVAPIIIFAFAAIATATSDLARTLSVEFVALQLRLTVAIFDDARRIATAIFATGGAGDFPMILLARVALYADDVRQTRALTGHSIARSGVMVRPQSVADAS